MSYAPELFESLVKECETEATALEHLLLALVRAGSSLSEGRSREHLTQGAGRRLGFITHQHALAHEGVFQKQLVNLAHQVQFFLAYHTGQVIHSVSIEAQ